MQVEDNSNSLSDKPTEDCCCSECSKKPMCPVISSIDNSILFVDYDIKLHCGKAMSFGSLKNIKSVVKLNAEYVIIFITFEFESHIL